MALAVGDLAYPALAIFVLTATRAVRAGRAALRPCGCAPDAVQPGSERPTRPERRLTPEAGSRW